MTNGWLYWRWWHPQSSAVCIFSNSRGIRTHLAETLTIAIANGGSDCWNFTWKSATSEEEFPSSTCECIVRDSWLHIPNDIAYQFGKQFFVHKFFHINIYQIKRNFCSFLKILEIHKNKFANLNLQFF